MHDLLIQNGRIIDPINGRDEIADLLIQDGRIASIGPKIPHNGVPTLNAKGMVVAPGLVDIHVHFREPGFEGSETLVTGARAAAAGGFTSVAPMANTNPVIDSAADIKFVLDRAREAIVNIYPIAAVTKGQRGEEIVEFGDLLHAGAAAFSDDGLPIMNNEIMRRAMEYCSMFGAVILDHCGDANLACDGVMYEGAVSTRLGLKGIPYVAESIQVARDVALAEFTRGRVHIMHVSCAASVDFIARAKDRGLPVTAEVTPHHLALTDEALGSYDTHAKMNPPLGNEAERQALIEALRSGVIDCISTDHAPHSAVLKEKVITEAPFGIVGLETAFMVVHTQLVKTGILTLPQLIERMTARPARILNIPKGSLSVGADADIAVLDTEWQGSITTDHLHSKSHNTPFLNKEVQGRVHATLVKGKIVFQEGKLL